MLPDIQPGNTKILYFFNCLLDGMHTILFTESVSLPAATQNLNYNMCARSSSALICDNIAGAISNTLLAPHSPFLESL